MDSGSEYMLASHGQRKDCFRCLRKHTGATFGLTIFAILAALVVPCISVDQSSSTSQPDSAVLHFNVASECSPEQAKNCHTEVSSNKCILKGIGENEYECECNGIYEKDEFMEGCRKKDCTRKQTGSCMTNKGNKCTRTGLGNNDYLCECTGYYKEIVGDKPGCKPKVFIWILVTCLHFALAFEIIHRYTLGLTNRSMIQVFGLGLAVGLELGLGFGLGLGLQLILGFGLRVALVFALRAAIHFGIQRELKGGTQIGTGLGLGLGLGLVFVMKPILGFGLGLVFGSILGVVLAKELIQKNKFEPMHVILIAHGLGLVIIFLILLGLVRGLGIGLGLGLELVFELAVGLGPGLGVGLCEEIKPLQEKVKKEE